MSIATNYHNALPIGYQLPYYRIQAILSEECLGITYLALDTKLNHQVAIKEYFPKPLAIRNNEQHVQLQSEKYKKLFLFGLQQFIQEGSTLARLKHPNIVNIFHLFKMLNTAYWVMAYEPGQSFTKVLESSPITQVKLAKILPPLFSALTALHEAGLLHRNIKPNSIYLRDRDLSPILVDFGATRYAFGSRYRNLGMMVTPGYSPFEQYQSEENQGAWTDIYALGAVLYHAISGKTPLEASERVKTLLKKQSDPLPPAIQLGHKLYSERLLQAIDWALEVAKQDRPQTVAQWTQFIFYKSSKQEKKRRFFNKRFFFQTAHPVKRVTVAILMIMIIAAGIGFGTLFYLKKHLAGLQQQQAALEQERVREANQSGTFAFRQPENAPLSQRDLVIERERVEQENTRATEHFLTLLQQPPTQVLASLVPSTSLPNQELMSLQGHTGGVCVDGCVAFSPDGQQLASGSWDNTIKLWDVKTGKTRQTLQGHTDLVLSIAFSPNGLLLASGSADNTIKLWEVSTGNVLKTLTEEGSWVGSLAFSPDGQTLAAEGAFNTIKRWALSTDKLLQTFSGHTNIINSVSFSPDGELLASGSADSTIKLWAAHSGDLLQTFTGHQKAVLSIAFSPDGQTLAAGDAASTIKLWEVHTGKALKTLKIHRNWVLTVIYSLDGSTLISGSHDHTIKFWDIQRGKVVQTLKGHKNDVNAIALSKDGRLFASGSRDKQIKLWISTTN
jgi:serine/threonine protein kinase/sugar lactone lactonase YvrE